MGNEHIRIDIRLLQCKSLTLVDKVVYAYLDLRQGQNTYSWPSVATIMRDLDLSRNTVRKSLKKLENECLLEVQRSSGGCGPDHTHHFYLHNLSDWLGSKADRGSKTDPPPQDGKGSEVDPQGVKHSHIGGSEFDPEKRDSKQGKKEVLAAVQFELFWNHYPEVRRGDWTKAVNAWNATLANTNGLKQQLAGEIIEGLLRWTRSIDWSDPQFIDFAGAFIAKSKWLDHPKNFGKTRA